MVCLDSSQTEWNDDTILPTTLNWTILKGNPSFPGRPWCSDICHFAYTFLSGFVRESENFRRAWFAQQRRSNVKYPSPRSAQECEESISHFELSHHHYHTSRKKSDSSSTPLLSPQLTVRGVNMISSARRHTMSIHFQHRGSSLSCHGTVVQSQTADGDCWLKSNIGHKPRYCGHFSPWLRSNRLGTLWSMCIQSSQPLYSKIILILKSSMYFQYCSESWSARHSISYSWKQIECWYIFVKKRGYILLQFLKPFWNHHGQLNGNVFPDEKLHSLVRRVRVMMIF